MKGFKKPNAKQTEEFEKLVRRTESQITRKWQRSQRWAGDRYILLEARGVPLPALRVVRDRLAEKHTGYHFEVADNREDIKVRGIVVDPCQS